MRQVRLSVRLSGSRDNVRQRGGRLRCIQRIDGGQGAAAAAAGRAAGCDTISARATSR